MLLVTPGFKESAKEEKNGCEAIRGGAETFLLVEDEEILGELVKGSIEEKGYNVITARDGVEAINILS